MKSYNSILILMESKRAKLDDIQAAELEQTEMTHFKKIVGAFLNYTIDSLRDVSRSEWDFLLLKSWMTDLEFDHEARIERLKGCIRTN